MPSESSPMPTDKEATQT